MVDFEIGKTYKSKTGKDFVVVENNGEIITIQHLRLKRKARKTLYCGVQAAVFDFGADMLLAEDIKPVEDETIEIGYIKQYTINNEKETYVNIFKRHKEEKEAS